MLADMPAAHLRRIESWRARLCPALSIGLPVFDPFGTVGLGYAAEFDRRCICQRDNAIRIGSDDRRATQIDRIGHFPQRTGRLLRDIVGRLGGSIGDFLHHTGHRPTREIICHHLRFLLHLPTRRKFSASPEAARLQSGLPTHGTE
ncbi:hypothetical protein [Nocardia vaccinii]|uniref:hypothetical protein n=1 Tax=Nocardia vaccinii TaxID=1822 RepID=UPI0012F4887A|nr:hypothetical protein [Nocardia vaccinii]